MGPVVALHAAAALIWAGALLPLAILVRRAGAAAAPAVARFSFVGIGAVFMLLATGPVLAVVQVGDPAKLIDTAYGRVLLVKLALVAVLLAIAALNRRVLTPRLAAGASAGLSRALAVDLVVMAAVFAAVAGWRVTPPPRALIAATQTRLAVHVHTDKAMADVTLVPGRAGANRASIVPLTADFAPLAPKEIHLELIAADGKLAPVERAATQGPDGSWRVDSLTVPYAGRYRLRLRLLIDDFTEAVLEDDVTVP
jgi:copper transport protein